MPGPVLGGNWLIRQEAAWLEATTALQTYGTMMRSPSGYPIQSPYVSVASKNAEIMIRVAAGLGLRLRVGHDCPTNQRIPSFSSFAVLRKLHRN